MAEPERIEMTFPPDPSFLRLARLATADAASRAGFDFEEIDDTRIAISELTALASSVAAGPITLVFTVHGCDLVVEGCCPATGPIVLGELSATIVDVLTDDYALSTEDGLVRFRASKRSKSPPRP